MTLHMSPHIVVRRPSIAKQKTNSQLNATWRNKSTMSRIRRSGHLPVPTQRTQPSPIDNVFSGISFYQEMYYIHKPNTPVLSSSRESAGDRSPIPLDNLHITPWMSAGHGLRLYLLPIFMASIDDWMGDIATIRFVQPYLVKVGSLAA